MEIMKKYITFLIALAFTLQASAQENQTKIINWFNDLAKETSKVTYRRMMDEEVLSYSVPFSYKGYRFEEAQDGTRKIRALFDELVPSATKSYRYEVHDERHDTISYSVSLGPATEESRNVYSPGHANVWNSKEMLTFDYQCGRGFGVLMLSYYFNPSLQRTDSVKMGNTEVLHQALTDFMESKKKHHPKSYPVQYEYSEDFDYGKSKTPLSYVYSEWNWHACKSEGTHYYIPLDDAQLVYDYYKELAELMTAIAKKRTGENYEVDMNVNPMKDIQTQHEQKEGYSFINLATIKAQVPVSGDKGHLAPSYVVGINCDKAGLHILELYSNSGWINYPAYWHVIKSMKNNEVELEKDFKKLMGLKGSFFF